VPSNFHAEPLGFDQQPSPTEPAPTMAQEPPQALDTGSLFSADGTARPLPAGASALPAAAQDSNGPGAPFPAAQTAAPAETNPDTPANSLSKPAISLFAATATDSSAAAPAVSPLTVAPGSYLSDSKSSPAANASASDAPSSHTALAERSEDGPELSPGLQAWNGGERASASTASSDRVTGSLAGAEMNVALRTEGLGAVQVRAHVTGDQVGAAITVERHDAHAALANDLPALHQALSERQLRVENVSLQQGSAHAGPSLGDGAARQQHQGGTPPRPSPFGSADTGFLGAAQNTGTAETSAENYTAFDSNGRLSVQA
jgi:flagellar hook-length control protein FliK